MNNLKIKFVHYLPDNPDINSIYVYEDKYYIYINGKYEQISTEYRKDDKQQYELNNSFFSKENIDSIIKLEKKGYKLEGFDDGYNFREGNDIFRNKLLPNGYINETWYNKRKNIAVSLNYKPKDLYVIISPDSINKEKIKKQFQERIDYIKFIMQTEYINIVNNSLMRNYNYYKNSKDQFVFNYFIDYYNKFNIKIQ